MKTVDIPGRKTHFPMEGVELTRNPKNGFVVFQLHYTANPLKRSDEWKRVTASNLPRSKFMQEYEITWETWEGKPVYPDFNVKVHGSLQPLEPEQGLPLLRGWDFGLCYDDKTEVLTKAGWKLFKDVDPEEPVAVLDPETFSMFYEVPKLKVDQPYDGKMIVWENQNLQACITPDHIVPVWKEESKKLLRYRASDLKGSGHNLIRLTANWTGEDRPNALGLDPKLFAGLMGAYLSEGSCDGSRVTIYQKDSNKAWVKEIIDKTSLDWRDVSDGVRLYCKDKINYFSSFGVSGEKFVPEEIRHGSKETILEFIQAYTLGDGHIRIRSNGSEEHTIYSKSKRMADDLSELALKVGWTSSIRKIKSSVSYYAEEDRWITSSPGWSICFKKTSAWAHLREAKKREIDYSGRVYCLSVSTGIICVRKNGRPHWNGNTPACIVAQLQGQQLVVLKEFVSVNMGIERFTRDVVLPSCRIEFPAWGDPSKDWLDFIDPAGLSKNQVDETTCAQKMAALGIRKIFPGALDWESRRGSVEKFLTTFFRRGNEILPSVIIDRAGCPDLVQGFIGGFRYPDKAIEVEPEQIRPIKNKYSHPHDGFQYLCSRVKELIRPGYGISRAIPKQGYKLG